MNHALLITGPPGAGKSSVLNRLGTLLEIREVPYGALETDEIARGWPFGGFEEWVPRLALVCADMRRAGHALLVVVATVETDDQLAATVRAIGAEQTTVVCVTAPPDIAAARVAAREPDDWPGKGDLVAHAATLALVIPHLQGVDGVISSVDLGAEKIAEDILTTYLSKHIF